MLKNIVAISLAVVFIFNWFGYRLFTSLLQDRADASLEIKLDNNNYEESQLICIKIPSSLPYYSNSKNYDRVNGQVTINGKHYNYVKRRLFNDSLEYLCIPNEEKAKLVNARDEFFKLVNDLQHPSQSKKQGNNSLASKNLLAEYCQHNEVSYNFYFFDDAKVRHLSFYRISLLRLSLPSPEQPPDVPRV